MWGITEAEKADLMNGKPFNRYRFTSAAIVLLQIAVTLFLIDDPDIQVGTMMIYPVFVYWVLKGFRFSFILLILMRSMDSFLAFPSGREAIVFILAWWLVICAVYFKAWAVENERAKLRKEGDLPEVKNHWLRATLVSLVIVVLTTLVGVFFFGEY